VPIPQITKDALKRQAKSWIQWHPVTVGVVTFLLVMTPMMIAVWNMHNKADQILKKGIHDQLLSAASVMAKVINVDAHESLRMSGQDLSAAYQQQVQKLNAAKMAVDQSRMIKFAYTCILDGADVRFVLDATPDGDSDHDGMNDRAKLMEIYEQPTATLLEVLKTGMPKVNQEPYTDRWGTFMSGFAPIFDSNGRLVAAAGVDMSLEDYELTRSGLRHVATMSALGVLFLSYVAGAWMAWYHRRLQNSVAELLRASEAAATAERVKADFLGSMSHELRTPMNAVLGMSEMLRQTALDEKQREMLETISNSGESLLATLTSILDYTQLDSRRLNVESEEIVVRSLLQDMQKTHAGELRKKGLTFEQSIAEDCPARFTGHAAFLRQVLSQLLSNAIKFTDAGSITVKVSAKKEGEGGLLQFAIQDTGIGIGVNHLEHLFEPLFQVDGTTTRRHGGTGMGLALCKRLCDAIHARLWVDSEPGRGSTFYVEVSSERFEFEKAPQSRQAVLWSDDSMTAMLATRVIEKTGTTVTAVSSLGELQRLVTTSEIAYVVLDANGVSVEDLTATRRLLQKARLIVLNGSEDLKEHALADVVIPSPLKPAELRMALG
jgi:signal transduction histidine kinase/CheY-like chemotaxis protein